MVVISGEIFKELKSALNENHTRVLIGAHGSWRYMKISGYMYNVYCIYVVHTIKREKVPKTTRSSDNGSESHLVRDYFVTQFNSM